MFGRSSCQPCESSLCLPQSARKWCFHTTGPDLSEKGAQARTLHLSHLSHGSSGSNKLQKVLQTSANLVPRKKTSTLWSENLPLNFFTLPRLHPRSLTAKSPEKMVGLEDDPASYWVSVIFFRGKLAVKLLGGSSPDWDGNSPP